jgi:hypothetical protein
MPKRFRPRSDTVKTATAFHIVTQEQDGQRAGALKQLYLVDRRFDEGKECDRYADLRI